MRVSSTPHSTAFSGAAVSAITRPSGSATPLSAIHLSTDWALVMVSMVVKVFDATATKVVAGSHFAERLLQRHPIDIGDDVHMHQRQVARQGIHRQRRAERAAANADMDQVLDLAQHAFMDRADQQPHPLAQCLGFLHAGIEPDAAQGGMFSGAAFGGVDHFAREQLVAHIVEPGGFGQGFEIGDQGTGQVGFRPVEQDRGRSILRAQRQPRRKRGHPLRILREQFHQRGIGMEGELLPGLVTRQGQCEILSYNTAAWLGVRTMIENRKYLCATPLVGAYRHSAGFCCQDCAPCAP